jgi:NarL family two-component system response regulator LiaR
MKSDVMPMNIAGENGAREHCIRVLVVDDHAIVRKGICALLATEPGIQVVGEAGDGQAAIEQVRRCQPDVVLMDLVMPGMDGLKATRYLREHCSAARILILTSFSGMDKVLPAIKAGALGYLLKDSGPEVLARAIRSVYHGDSSLHPAVARTLLEQLFRIPEQDVLLTDREISVLRLVAQGCSNQDIADELAIREATVRTHVSHILSKLGLSSRTQAALYALRAGLVSLDETDAWA